MILIDDYILLTKEERQKHLKLEEPCLERGGNSSYCKGLLAHIFNTTIPSGNKIHVCHACNNGKCSNVNHLYWGTSKENSQDAIACGARKTIWEHMISKHGLEKAKKLQNRGSKLASKAGKGNTGKPKSAEHRKNLSKALTGNKSKKLNISTIL